MSNYHVEPASKPQALTSEALKALRHEQVQGISRRRLLRTSLGAGVGLWLLEVAAGYDRLPVAEPRRRFRGQGCHRHPQGHQERQQHPARSSEGFPAYYQDARAFIMLVDPSRQEFIAGDDRTGDGTSLNVRALYQRCPHLGCKPNPCLKSFWLECPCHGSRYDRLGTKVKELGPAPRSMDRFAISVDEKGVLTLDTSRITLGPLPVAWASRG